MKKTVVLIFIFLLIIGLIACGTSSKLKDQNSNGDDLTATNNEQTDKYEIALILGIGGLEQSLNYEAWQGVSTYAQENNIKHKYYTPKIENESGWMTSIEEAVNEGAKIIIAPGMCFEEVIYKAQDLFPEAQFVLIDGEPHNSEGSDYKTANNTTCIIYAEQQAGYLAGYAAVKEGYTKLGFMGGMQTPQIERFGYGFLKGADDAAVEKGTFVQTRYTYLGTYTASPDVQTSAAAWYADGTELIFSCGGQILDSITAAAEADTALGKVDELGNPKKSVVINVDTTPDKTENKVIISSALKGVNESVQRVLTEYYSKKFPSAQTLTVTASDNGVGLPMDYSDFTNFTKEQYDDIFGRLAAGGIEIPVDTTVESPDLLPLTNNTVILG